jgi:hypothetical protein
MVYGEKCQQFACVQYISVFIDQIKPKIMFYIEF